MPKQKNKSKFALQTRLLNKDQQNCPVKWTNRKTNQFLIVVLIKWERCQAWTTFHGPWKNKPFCIRWFIGTIILVFEKFVAFLTQTKDVPSWIVEIDTQLGKEVKARGGIISNGTLSDGSTLIEINPIENWSNGKISKLFPILGFEFVFNGQYLAAVQVSKSMGSKKYVWVKNNLSKELELILATAATTVMAMVDNQAMR